ncbi:MAG TPA: hypothetical protein PLD60_08225, partial [Leptospiraceae bacterium]|nr:hypothetical protein [Leptospiraceae bacterium]
MDVLVQKLFGASGRFSTDEQSFLKTQTGDVQKAFALRSAQELVTSGLFESAGAALFASLDAQGMSAAEKADRAQNQNAYLRAFVESLYAANQVGTLSQASSDFLASHAGLAAKIATAISVMDPNLKNVLLSETVLLNRFFTQFQESDADRNAIVSALTDPTVLGLGADLSTTLEADRDLVLSQTEAQGLLASISGTVSSHVRFFADKQREYSRKKEVADSMLTFAQKLGSSKPADAASYQDARVQNWRTYSGSEAAYRDTAYANYEKDYATQLAAYNADPTKNPYPGPKLSANEYFNALSLNVTSVNNGKTASEILDGDYAGNLLSDDPAGTIPVQIDDPDHPGQKKTVYINKYGAVTVNATSSADFKEVYYANLANNYIDAISHLSASISGIVEAANLADSRASADTDEITKLATIANDAANTDNAKKEAAILAEQQLRQSDAAANGDQQITQVQSDFGSAIGATAKAQDDYASAGRRSLINRIGTKSFLETILTKASAELNAAQATVKTLSDASVSLQATYNALVGDYTNRMNDMAAAFREFTARNKEAQTRQDIKDFASTPYLYLADNAAGTAGLASNVGDAQNMFNSAKTALDAINKQLANAADLVFAEDHMSDFATVAAAVSSAKKAGTDPASLYPPLSTAEAKTLADLRAKAVKLVDDQGNKIAIDGTTGTPLSVSERDQLTALTQRELYANYADVFTTRAEFLEQSLRTIRIEKAAAILQSEIAKRSAEAQQAKTDFTGEMNRVFGFRNQSTPELNAAAEQAKIAVYNRLKNRVGSSGAVMMYDEWRAWFWGGKQWKDTFGSQFYGAWVGGSTDALKVTPTQIAEGAIGMTIANQVSSTDQKAIGTFLGAGGMLAAFSGFTGVYATFLGTLGGFDAAALNAQLIAGTFIPAMGVGTGMVVTGQMMVAQGTALALVGVGLPMINSGYVMIAGGTSLIRLSMQKLAEAATQLTGATWNMQWAQGMALNAGNDVSDIRRVMAKEVTYNNAQAALDYFTKIPDLKTMKERLIAWGKNHADDPNEKPPGSALYNLTDDDIKYLYDTIAGNLDSTGKPVNLSGNDATIALDVTGKKQLTDFMDSMGRRYDPSTLTETQPGPLSGGAYVGAGNVQYTKVTVMSDDGLHLTEKYAVILETDPNATGSAANERASYNLLDILPMLVNKMETIRDDAKSAYLAAGQAASAKTNDSTFTLNEQSETLQEVFVAATNREDGGREFAGYTNAYNDFSQNAKAISDQELAQREALQKQEWDLKQQDFLDRRAEWETKIANILDRGKKEWAENQSKFLQQWDDWEKGFDKDTKDGQAAWDAKMAQFFTDRAKWKSDITIQSARATATNTLTGAINDLNSQLAQFAENTGMASRSIDLQATLAQAYASIEKTMPTNTDRLRDINNDISNFNTQLALSQMSGQNLTSSISGLQ